MVSARLIVLPLYLGVAHDAAQVLIPDIIHRDERNMESLLVVRWVLVGPLPRCDIRFEPE